MVQFNLLPDVKLEYIKAERSKRLVIATALIAAGASLALLIILFLGVNVAQKKNMNDLSKDIKSDIATLHKVPDLGKVLTIQNQLKSLPDLHDKKPVASRLFDYITKITPAAASIDNLTIDFTANTITLTGSADSITTINKFADTLKFASYKTVDTTNGKPFDHITTTLNRDDTHATYSISMEFNPEIFESEQQVTMIVPKIISTRSEVEKPSALFDAKPAGGQ